MAKKKIKRRKKIVRRGLRARTIKELPAWAKDHVEYRCKEWYRLSSRAILVICDNRMHISRDTGGAGVATGFILKWVMRMRYSHWIETPFWRRETIMAIPRISCAKSFRPPYDDIVSGRCTDITDAEAALAYAILY